MQENVKKCKNFLATLIKLASHNSPSPETSKNVKSLVQDLLVSLTTLTHYITSTLPLYYIITLFLHYLYITVLSTEKHGILLSLPYNL